MLVLLFTSDVLLIIVFVSLFPKDNRSHCRGFNEGFVLFVIEVEGLSLIDSLFCISAE